MKTTTSALRVKSFQVSVFIGINPGEQDRPQTILLDMHIQFAEPPQACVSDQIQDTYCYDQLLTIIRNHLRDKKFQLIEHFTFFLYRLLKDYFPAHTKVMLGVTKQPPITGLQGGVTFEYGDTC